ncbi:hypothetical protein [Bosea sp. ASV33]|uniref:hypothetical protein n=1 Tax=Bosea sp. ASV33 TaxID=2795106 RepID=UPI0018ECFE9A|nr:hypothetical protein [Bosea sp. ASV33]
MRGFDVASASVRPEPSKVELTKTQRRALSWIDTFPCHQAEWRTGDKPAKGAPENWDRMRLLGPDGSIVVMLDDWRALNGLLDPAPFGSKDKIYVLSEAGRAALSVLENSPAGLADAHSKSPSRPAMPKEEDTHG